MQEENQYHPEEEINHHDDEERDENQAQEEDAEYEVLDPNRLGKIKRIIKILDNREPMLYVDVNLGSSGSQRIVVFEGDKAEDLAAEFA